MTMLTEGGTIERGVEKRYLSIAAFRKDQQVSQQALAKLLKISQSALSMIENGERMPRPELIAKIVATCHVPVQALVKQRLRRRRRPRP